MNRDTLFLLAPGFTDDDRLEYCPECAEIWGLLAYFPSIRDSLEIMYQPLEKPRAGLVERLGDKNQNCPTLVLAQESPLFDALTIPQKNGHRFLNNARDIGKYYALRFGTPWPRGS